MSQLTSVVSSLLMSLPLIAVPCLALIQFPVADSLDAKEQIEIGGGLGESSLGAADFGSEGGQPFGPLQNADALGHVNANPTDSFGGLSDAKTVSANAARGLAETGLAAGDGEHDHDHPHALGLDDPATGVHAHETLADANPIGIEHNPFLPEATGARENMPAGGADTSDSVPGGGSELNQLLAELRELGVQQYQVAKSEVAGEVFFCCFVRTSQNILQRFEAEAATPSEAARDVLNQVKSWQTTR